MRLSLDEFSLPKYYSLFGISKVQSAATTAFRSATRTQSERFAGADRSFAMSPPDREPLSLDALAEITDVLCEIMEHCIQSLPGCNWLQQWTALAKSFAFRYNPALQPRGLVVFGCIAKQITDHDVKQLLRHLVKALESFSDITLIEAIVMCLTRLQPLLRSESPIHMSLFWVAISILQLDESSLYASGLAFLEQNLIVLDNNGAFDKEPIDSLMMSTREALEWYFKQQDHSVGLSFKNNFHFALVGHLIKGYRHPSSSTVARTTRVLGLLLEIVNKSYGGKDKFEVNKQNVAYLSALVSVSEEVRNKCRVKHNFTTIIPDSPTFDSFAVDNHLKAGVNKRGDLSPPVNDNYPQAPHSAPPAANQRQKSLEYMDQNAVSEAKEKVAASASGPSASMTAAAAAAASGGSAAANIGKLEKRSNSVPSSARNADSSAADNDDANAGENSAAEDDQEHHEDQDQENLIEEEDKDSDDNTVRQSITKEPCILLDPEILNDQVTQVLVLTVMATLVKYTTHESEVRILYEYLAEASVVFPKVFPVIHSLLDAKITNVLSLCHDKTILAAVQSIIENMIACEDEKSQQQLHFLQVRKYAIIISTP